jgi:hypothetical protein
MVDGALDDAGSWTGERIVTDQLASWNDGEAVRSIRGFITEAAGPGPGFIEPAYVTSEAEPDINADTLTYVENYVPDHSGDNFLAHVTVGQGKLDDLSELEGEDFERFTFHPSGLAIYHLGNNGTAQIQLHRWNLT